MRGVAPFADLWQRHTTAVLDGSVEVNMLGLADLIQAKKTQRDKDWIMIRKLLARHYRVSQREPTNEPVAFWLREGRTSQMLRVVANPDESRDEATVGFPDAAKMTVGQRPLIAFALSGDIGRLNKELAAEERAERQADRTYWAPLKAELQQLRHARRRRGP